jgi:hypothetical protein
MMKIGYIVHDLNDPSVERRCAMLERGGAQVVLAGFHRGEDVNAKAVARKPFLLGRTYDAAMAKRATQTVSALAKPGKLRAHFAGCQTIMARNLEQLAVAFSVLQGRPLIYECLDIHRMLVSNALPARMVQRVEARLLKRVDLLLTSSPAFSREHFNKRPLTAPTYLIENKLVVDQVPDAHPAQLKPDLPLRIGWFGMLRCRSTFEVLSELVARSEGRIEVMISGKPSPAELPTLAEDVSAIPSMSYTGPYTYADLPALYGQCHFAWAVDWFEVGLNSQWLLPNRLYEALAHGAVPIVLDGTQMSEWAESHHVGLRVGSAEDAMNTLLNMDADDISRHQSRVQNVTLRDVMADDEDCRALVAAIASAGQK